MPISSILTLFSILFEAAVCVLGVALAVSKKKRFGWGIALTFGIYVVYDLARVLGSTFPEESLAVLFLIASASILWTVWTLWSAPSA
jgi:hypothetical protein